MVVDIGGGTTDFAVLSLGGVIEARSLRIAGNAMDEAIIRYIRREHQLLISEANAERIKIEAGSASRQMNGLASEIHIRGRDLRNGKPKSTILTPQHIKEFTKDGIWPNKFSGGKGKDAVVYNAHSGSDDEGDSNDDDDGLVRNMNRKPNVYESSESDEDESDED